MRRFGWVVAMAAAAAVVVGPGVAVAAAPTTGSPAALRLVRQILAHVRTVVAVRWREHGTEYLCPRKGRYPVLMSGDGPPWRGCRATRVEHDLNLSEGRVASEITILTPKGRPREVALMAPDGNWLRTPRGCWVGFGPRHELAAMSFAGEHVSIVGHRRRVILLRGTMARFSELDVVNARTHAVLSVASTWNTGRFGISHIFATFTEETQPFRLPTPTPRCSG